MSFRFVEGATSDLAFEATGPDLGEVLAAAAEALLAATVGRPGAVEPRVRREIRLDDTQADLLLLRFLNELIYLRDAEELLLRPIRVRVSEDGGTWELRAELAGEPLDPARHALSSDVKAATAHGLEVARHGAGWRATVTLDV